MEWQPITPCRLSCSGMVTYDTMWIELQWNGNLSHHKGYTAMEWQPITPCGLRCSEMVTYHAMWVALQWNGYLSHHKGYTAMEWQPITPCGLCCSEMVTYHTMWVVLQWNGNLSHHVGCAAVKWLPMTPCGLSCSGMVTYHTIKVILQWNDNKGDFCPIGWDKTLSWRHEKRAWRVNKQYGGRQSLGKWAFFVLFDRVFDVKWTLNQINGGNLGLWVVVFATKGGKCCCVVPQIGKRLRTIFAFGCCNCHVSVWYWLSRLRQKSLEKVFFC